MTRTQSDVGSSLPLLYDTVGQRTSGNSDLNDRDIALVHELGAQALAERVRSRFVLLQSGAINQSTAFVAVMANATIAALGRMARLINVVLFVDTAARVDNATVNVERNDNTLGVPLYSWNTTQGTTRTVRLDGVTGNRNVLVPDAAGAAMIRVPYTYVRVTAAPVNAIDTDAEEIVLRGTTTAFGVGTVEVAALLHFLVFDTASLPGVPAIPLPSW